MHTSEIQFPGAGRRRGRYSDEFKRKVVRACLEPGVSQANVNFDKRQAIVTFDGARTNVDALTESTKNAGYPSTVMEAAN